jgi:hypothetical protein
VDNDPVVHVRASALLAGSDTTSIVLADLRDPRGILAHPGVTGLIDFTRPVALLLVAVLHFITDAEDPGGILATLTAGLPAGSWLALSHATADFRPDAARQAAAVYDQATSAVTLRSHAGIAGLFGGWDLIDRVWSRPRCGGRMGSGPGDGSWPVPGCMAVWPARAPDRRGRSCSPARHWRVMMPDLAEGGAVAGVDLEGRSGRELLVSLLEEFRGGYEIACPARAGEPWMAVPLRPGALRPLLAEQEKLTGWAVAHDWQIPGGTARREPRSAEAAR